jgi:hypothetical protein
MEGKRMSETSGVACFKNPDFEKTCGNKKVPAWQGLFIMSQG